VNHNWRGDWHADKRRKHHAIWAWMPVLAALASMLAIGAYRYIEVWTPLQRFYFKTYMLTGLRSVGGKAKSRQYELLAVTTKNGSHWASDGEVSEARTESGRTTVALTQEARKNGGLHLALVTVESNDGNLHDFLWQGIYRGESLAVFLRPALWGGLGVLFLLPACTLFGEAVRAYRRRRGTRSNAPSPASPQSRIRQNLLRGAGPDPTYENSPVAPLTRDVFSGVGPVNVEPHAPRTVTTVASSADSARRKIMQDETRQEPERKSKRKPGRKERYFQ